MSSRLSDSWVRYGSALFFVAVATGLTGLMGQRIATTPFALFLIAVAVTAYYGGRGPGLVATGLSLLGVNLLFVYPLLVNLLFGPPGTRTTLNGATFPPGHPQLEIRIPAMIVFCGLCGLISYAMDRQKHTVKAAKGIENELQRVLDSITEMTFTVDSAWHFTHVNQRLAEFTNQSTDYYKGKLLWDEFPSIVGKIYEEKYREAVATGQPITFEAKSEVSNRWWLVRAFPHEGLLSVFVADTTEAKQATQILTDREEQLRLALEGAQLGDWEWMIGTETLHFSRRSGEIFGLLPQEQLTYKGFLEMVHPADRAFVKSAVEYSVARKTDYAVEYRVIWPDQSVHWIAARGRPFYSSDDEPLRMLGVVLDVTAQKQAEEEKATLLESEQLARAEAERAGILKDEFLATLSHELRTPLNAILGWSHLLRDWRLAPEEKSTGIAVIERNARVQIQLIEDLLDMSRIISGKMHLETQYVDLATVMKGAVESVRPAAAAKQIDLQVRIEPRVGPVMGDPGRLQQIIWNLLTNAIKFTPAKGRVQVALERISAADDNSPLAQIRVIDTGQGITAEFLPYVFDRFRQQDGSTTRRHGGLGLGLGIVQHLTQLHGGIVQADSLGAGRGATFTVRLPVATLPTKPTDDDLIDSMIGGISANSFAGKAKLKLNATRILVVDDELDARELLKKLLSECDAQVMVATSAQEALELMAQERFDVLISDIGMPGEDGYHLIRQIRQRHEMDGGLTPAIALTAYARADDRREALQAGFDLHLSKPVDPNELIATVAKMKDLKH